MKFIVDTFPPSVFTSLHARQKSEPACEDLAEHAKLAQTPEAVSAAPSAGLSIQNPLPFVKTQMSQNSKLDEVISVRVDSATREVVASLQNVHGLTERQACKVVRAALVVGLGVLIKTQPSHTLALADAVGGPLTAEPSAQ